jgi:hypothetical protein
MMNAMVRLRDGAELRTAVNGSGPPVAFLQAAPACGTTSLP